MISRFTELLLAWNSRDNDRQMPWKGEKDPYRIWLSEVILQQTRVEQGLAYYHRFIERYPTIEQLASAPEQEVFRLWQGLGYYSRCRNLLHTARTVMSDFGGRFPRNHDDIRALKGVGAYTAAAISSFAYGEPYAVVDGNVVRVIARLTGMEAPVDLPDTRKKIEAIAAKLLHTADPGTYNQAMMDFGATVCKPRQPLCPSCPMQDICLANRNDKTTLIPLKSSRAPSRHRWFYYLMVEYRGRVLVRERQGKDIWRHLHELVLAESPAELDAEGLSAHPAYASWLDPGWEKEASMSAPRSQQLTHQRIQGRCIYLRLRSKPAQVPEGYQWVATDQLTQLAFPVFIVEWLRENGHYTQP
jgi:A/G-specific adenine glycosylase